MAEKVTPEELSRLEGLVRDDNAVVTPQIAFPAGEYASRLNKLRNAMGGKKDPKHPEEMIPGGADVVLLSSPEAQCWLHGYQARWYRTGSTTEWAPCNFTAVHISKNAVIRVPLNGARTEDTQYSNHTIFKRSAKAQTVKPNPEWNPKPEHGLELTDGFLLFDSSDHKDLIQFTSVAEGFCHFDDPKHPEDAKPDKESVHKFLLDELEAQGWLTKDVVIGIEMWSPRQNAATTADLSEQLTKRFTAKIKDVTVPLRDLQRIKSDAELDVMKEAANILDAAYAHVLSGNLHVSSRNIRQSDDPIQRTDPPKTMRLHAGMTEMQVWAEMEWAMAQEGGETAGLHNTVSRTRRYCHALSSTRPINNGPLLLDPCAVKHRYHVNTARQFYLGRKVPPELAKASKIAADAIEVLHKTAKAGDPFSVVSTALQKYYKDAGIWNLREWIGGYQFGIAFTPDWVGEFTWDIDFSENKTIQKNLVASFESFVGGAGCIDTVIFGDAGVEAMSSLSREIQPIDHEIPDWWQPARTS